MEKVAKERSGIGEDEARVTDDAMASLIEDYCREAGVRNLQKHLEKIYRKVALKLAKEKGPEASKRVGDSRAKLLSAKKQVADKEEELRVAKITNGTEPKPAKSGGGKTKNTKESSLDSLSAALAELRDLVLSNEKDVHAALALTAVQDPVVVNAGADLVQYVGKYFPITTFRLCDCPYETDTFFFIVSGQPPFQTDRIYDKTPPGVVTGLAWTSMGGSTLYIECTGIHQNAVNDFDDDEMEDGDGDDDYKRTAPKRKGESSKRKNKLIGGSRKTVGGTLKTTGQLGDVMTESATIAHTFAKNFVALRHPGNDYFDVTKLHLHVPAGSTPKVGIGAFTKSRTTVCAYPRLTLSFIYPKDGPSAGCTMVTAMVSLATGKAVRPNLAMTGEVTLTGIVMPIGGVKEKTIAARRSGVTHILFPEGNKKDFHELSAEVKQGLEVFFVKTYDDVYKHALEWDVAE